MYIFKNTKFSTPKVLITYRHNYNFMNPSCPLQRSLKFLTYNGIQHWLLCIEIWKGCARSHAKICSIRLCIFELSFNYQYYFWLLWTNQWVVIKYSFILVIYFFLPVFWQDIFFLR
jgi:hypothetical protein